MTRTRRFLSISAAAATAALVLAGCGPSSPSPTLSGSASESPTPSASPSPSPTPEAVADFVVVTGTSISVGDASSMLLVDLPFDTTDAEDAATALTDLLGEPEITSIEGGSCNAPTTLYDWGGLRLADPSVVTSATGSRFTILITAAVSAGGYDLYGPHFQQVGNTAELVLSVIPGSEFFADGFGGGTITLDTVVAEPEFDAWGAAGYVADDILTVIQSPVYFFGDC